MLNLSAAIIALSSLVSAAQNTSELVFNYSPIVETCPAINSSAIYNSTTHEGYIRSNYVISQDEYSYINARQVQTTDSLIEFLNDLQIPGYTNTSFANYFGQLSNQSAINIGLAFSGGGFRALLTGSGEHMALDSRTTLNSSLKGLLDSSTYIAGLSGSSIMLSTLLFNNWTSVEDIITTNSSLWNTTEPPVSTDLSFWTGLLQEVEPKKKAGYPISLVDVYGRILSRYMFEEDDDNYGLNTLWSDIKYTEAFANYDIPFPIILATGGISNDSESDIDEYSTNVFEINPFEFGSFSPFVGGFVPIEILGTLLDEGLPINSTSDNCTYEFDNAGLMVASSSNILAGFQNNLIAYLNGNDSAASMVFEEFGTNVSRSYVKTLIDLVNNNLNNTLFTLVDNPFYNSSLSYSNVTSDISDETILKLVDGGLFEEGIPLDPFLTPVREMDIVIAFDNSGNTEDNWPNGTALYATEERWLESFPDDDFYELPETVEDFVDLGLNKRPVFFGCNGSNLITNEGNPNATVEFSWMKPLLVYIPNTNYTYMSNVTEYQFSIEDRNSIIYNGFEIAQYNNETDFAQCMGCAIIKRSEERANIETSPFCEACFEKYCFVPDYTESNSTYSSYSNKTEIENMPTSIYSSSALPSHFSSLLSRSEASIPFPTSFVN